MAEEFLGKKVKLTYTEKKPKVISGKVLEINELGIVFEREDYRNSGSRTELVLREDIVAIAEPLKKQKKSPAKPKTTPKPEVAAEPVPPVPEPPSDNESSDDFVNDDDFSDEDDLDFD